MRENEFKALVDHKWGYLCYGAMWYEPLMDNLNAYIDKANDKVTGRVTVKLYKGVAEALAVETANTIFNEKLATFMDMTGDKFNQNASAGFIEHYSMQMRLSQRRRRTALLSIGGIDSKRGFLASAKQLKALGYKLYGTTKTHAFLLKNGIEATLVNKISTPELKPNLEAMLDAKRFDIIINIPTKTDREPTLKQEKTDGQIIREKAVASDTPLITNLSVARDVVVKLVKAKV
jgi:argininosuccinate synthase